MFYHHLAIIRAERNPTARASVVVEEVGVGKGVQEDSTIVYDSADFSHGFDHCLYSQQFSSRARPFLTFLRFGAVQ